MIYWTSLNFLCHQKFCPDLGRRWVGRGRGRWSCGGQIILTYRKFEAGIEGGLFLFSKRGHKVSRSQTNLLCHLASPYIWVQVVYRILWYYKSGIFKKKVASRPHESVYLDICYIKTKGYPTKLTCLICILKILAIPAVSTSRTCVQYSVQCCTLARPDSFTLVQLSLSVARCCQHILWWKTSGVSDHISF